MRRVLLLCTLSIVLLAAGGFSEPEYCYTQTVQNCSDAPSLTTCNMVCKKYTIPFEGFFACAPKEGSEKTDQFQNSFAGVVSVVVQDENQGEVYCEKGPVGSAVYCFREFRCTDGCDRDEDVGLDCERNDNTLNSFGHQVQPEEVDWEKPCPYYCKD